MKWVFSYVKVLLRSCLPDMFLQLMRSLKWDTAKNSISKGLRITAGESQKFQKRPTLLSKLGWSKVWLLVFPMPLEIELHAVPHFKGLIKGKKISGRQERGSTLT